jgi:neurofibromin 1
MDNYPEEFTELQKRPNDELEDSCDKLFELFHTFAERSRKKAQVWPLQMMLLVLCPVSFFFTIQVCAMLIKCCVAENT